ncbi:MAG: hypothetical protein MRERV_4c014 [Mycoplasmataceae bacterium RV_VA103A]|nr:MAG: hypothetical protein MRERV_23c013 [Mycoplasmataceae bacterium RV_VA103A]KLL05136.1 MAG: hypothetical protein MRERV_4c014 [Mycoplasmataceae bacterium RV_VA103A]
MSNQANEIKFYHKGNSYGRPNGRDYYEFTNYYQNKPINFPQISGWENLAGSWPSAEHLFQAAKFADWPECVAIFKNLDTSQGTRKAFEKAIKKARQKAGEPWVSGWHGDWQGEGKNSRKIEVMRLIVEEKFTQDKYLQDLLLETGDKEIIEDTESDTGSITSNGDKRDGCWGNAKENKNWLGKILMGVRNKLVNKQTPKPGPNPPPQSPPTNPSQPNTPNGGPNSPNPNPNSPNPPSDNNKSPNQEEQNNPNDNGPTPNPPTNGDNHDPEKNNDSPLPNSDADVPPIDMSGINNAATTEQAQQEARTQIQKLFTQSKVNPSDLDPGLWGNKSNWEEYLQGLTTNQEIADFVQEMAKKISEKQLANQNKNNNYSSNSPNKNEILAWLIGGGMGLVILIFALLIFRQKRIKNKLLKRG